MDSDYSEIESQLSARFYTAWCRLVPLDVACANPVFRVEFSDGRKAFAKIGDGVAMARTAVRLKELSACSYVPRVLLAPEPAVGGGRVLCLEWKVADRIEVVDLTDAQADSLVDGALALSTSMQHATDVRSAMAEDDPAKHYGVVCEYARRHPLVAGLLSGVLAVPESDRAYGARPLATIHGDFHALNFGFSNGRFSAVFDFDSLTKGLPCEDLAYALCEDMRRHDLGRGRRQRLKALFARFVARAPWPMADWRFAVNHARLRIAARRLAKHPGNPWVALDVFRRDRKLRPLLDLCGGELV